MKQYMILLILCLQYPYLSRAQSWGNWIDVGNGIQVSFKFGRTPCTFANTYARLRNTSGNKYCFVNVSFTSVCDDKTREMSVSANQLGAGQIEESSGSWYVTSLQVSNIKLTKLQNEKCQTVSPGSMTGAVVSGSGSQSNEKGFSIDQSGDYVNAADIQKQKQLDYDRQKKAEGDAAAWEILKATGERKQAEQQRLTEENKRKQEQYDGQQDVKRQNLIKQQTELQERVQKMLDDQQQNYKQTQKEYTNAQAAATSAYDAAITSGKKESGAFLDGMLSAAQNTSDPTLGAAYTGTGLVLGGLMALSEKKAAKRAIIAEQERKDELERERQAAIREEEEKERQMKEKAINDKRAFIASMESKFFTPNFSQLSRQAILIYYSSKIESGSQDIFISTPIQVNAYADGSFPLKENLFKKIANGIPLVLSGNPTMKYTLIYPIQLKGGVEFEQILSTIGGECTKNMISPKIYNVVVKNEQSGSNKSLNTPALDFWGNPIKGEKLQKKESPASPKKIF